MVVCPSLCPRLWVIKYVPTIDFWHKSWVNVMVQIEWTSASKTRSEASITRYLINNRSNKKI